MAPVCELCCRRSGHPRKSVAAGFTMGKPLLHLSHLTQGIIMPIMPRSCYPSLEAPRAGAEDKVTSPATWSRLLVQPEGNYFLGPASAGRRPTGIPGGYFSAIELRRPLALEMMARPCLYCHLPGFSPGLSSELSFRVSCRVFAGFRGFSMPALHVCGPFPPNRRAPPF